MRALFYFCLAVYHSTPYYEKWSIIKGKFSTIPPSLGGRELEGGGNPKSIIA